MATPAPIAPSTIDRSPLVNGASVPEPSFAYTDLRGIGKVDIDDLLDYVHDTAREFPGYLRLYEKYLKQRWDVTELDFTTDILRLERAHVAGGAGYVPEGGLRISSRRAAGHGLPGAAVHGHSRRLQDLPLQPP